MARRLSPKALLVIAATFAAWPGSSWGAEKLVIISPHWEGLRREYTRAFEAWHHDRYGEPITVEFLDLGGTSEIIKFIRSEYSGDRENVTVDIFWGGGTDPYLQLAKEGFLAPYRVPDGVLEQIPPHIFGMPMYDPQFRWYGTALAGFGIIYNKVVLDLLHLPAPATWEDLARPEFATWVGSADPRASGSVHMMYEIMLQTYGWEKGIDVITRIGANVRSFPDSSSRIPKDVSAGEIACGLAIDIYAQAQINEAGPDKIGYVMPEGQTVINPDSIAILRGAPHREAAERFLEFVLSEQGQSLLMLPPGADGGPTEFQLGRMCVIPALYGKLGGERIVPTDPFRWKTSLKYDADKGGLRWTLVNDLVGALIIDTHDDLVRAWEAIGRGGMREDALAKLGEAPITEAEGLELARWKWDDDEARSVERSAWVRFAQRKYREAYRLSGGAGREHWRAVGRVVRLAIPLGAAAMCVLLVCDLIVRGLRSLCRRRG